MLPDELENEDVREQRMFFGHYSPKLEDIIVNEDGIAQGQRDGNALTWLNQHRDATRVNLGGPPGWKFDCTQIDAARGFYEKMAQDLKGVLLDFDFKKIQGIEALVGTFKYRAPMPKSMAMYYVGIVWLPFRDFCFQVNFESLERGTTGMREASVMMLEPVAPSPVQQQPVAMNSMEDMFEHIRNQPLRRIPSDEAKWDQKFPDHPLSKVRAMLGRFENGAKFTPKLLKQVPYRVKI